MGTYYGPVMQKVSERAAVSEQPGDLRQAQAIAQLQQLAQQAPQPATALGQLAERLDASKGRLFGVLSSVELFAKRIGAAPAMPLDYGRPADQTTPDQMLTETVTDTLRRHIAELEDTIAELEHHVKALGQHA